MKHSIKTPILIVVFSLMFAPAAGAHKATIFAWSEGDTVYTQSKFSGGKPVKGGEVAVFDDDGTRLLDGRTNANGEFSFKVPAITDLNIVLSAGMGHQNSWLLTATELGKEPPKGAAHESLPSIPLVSGGRHETVPPAVLPGLTTQALEAIVARQLEQKLQPLTRMVAATQDKGPTVSDILGGIGYIVGLVGLGAYVRYRKEGRRP